MPIPFQVNDLMALQPDASRERATWVYGALRFFLDVPASSRTDRLLQFTAEIDSHPKAREIRDIFREFWSHHSYIRVITEAGLPDEVFLLRELLARALRHLMPVDEVQGDLYVLLDSLNPREEDAQWVASLSDSFVEWWAGNLHFSDVAMSFAGIILVGLLNIFTSFVLSFLLAVRARNIGEAKARRFLKEVGLKVVSHPLPFLLPGFD
jgi:site-specific recombinase